MCVAQMEKEGSEKKERMRSRSLNVYMYLSSMPSEITLPRLVL